MVYKLGIDAALQRKTGGVSPIEAVVKSVKNQNMQPHSYSSNTVRKDKVDAAAAVTTAMAVLDKADVTNPEEKDLYFETIKFSHDPFGALNSRRPRSQTICNISKIAPSSNSNSGTQETTRLPKRKAVKINPTVSVIPIPSRDEYSPRVCSCIWTSQSELSAQASRNIHEFVSEGWNWRMCVEDDGMYVCNGNELIHPVHFASCFTHLKHPNTSY